MKKKAFIALLLIAIMLMASVAAFAESCPETLVAMFTNSTEENEEIPIVTNTVGLTITGTSPKQGKKNLQPSNVAVKITFSSEMSTDNDAYNKALISIKDAEGNEQDFTIVHHDKYADELWCILSEDLVTNTEYTVVAKAGIVAKDGSTLGADYSFGFKTRNTKRDNTISIVLMIGMMIVMTMVTSKSVQNSQQENNAKSKTAGIEEVAQANPYKYAKLNGISVEEAKEKIAKEQAKLNKKNASAIKAKEKFQADEAAKEEEIQKRLAAIHEASLYKVKCAGSLKGHGHELPKSVAKKLAAKKKASNKANSKK